MENEKLYFEVKLIRESERAILVEHKREEVWLPKSQVEWKEDAAIGEEFEVLVPVWLARQNGMI